MSHITLALVIAASHSKYGLVRHGAPFLIVVPCLTIPVFLWTQVGYSWNNLINPSKSTVHEPQDRAEKDGQEAISAPEQSAFRSGVAVVEP